MRNCPVRVSFALLTVGLAVAGHAQSGQAKQNKKDREVKTYSIPAPVHFEFSDKLGSGRIVKDQDGTPGTLRQTFRVSTVNGKTQRELLLEERTEPKPTIFRMGKAGFSASRSSFVRSRVLRMTATAYDPSPATIRGGTGKTATGRRAAYGIVAVDPRVIPLNSLVFVEGYGFAIAADTGGAIKGNRIDLCYDSRNISRAFGRKPVTVHVMRVR